MSEKNTKEKQVAYAILLAAGKGTRFDFRNVPPKQFYIYENNPLWWYSARSFDCAVPIKGIFLVVSEKHFLLAQQQVQDYPLIFDTPIEIVYGGKRRQDSVINALKALPPDCNVVSIHDAARPFLPTSLVISSLGSLKNNKEYDAVIPIIPVTDTIKVVQDNQIITTPQRETLKAIQTPQVFKKDMLIQAYEHVTENNEEVTDDAMAFEKISKKILCVKGEVINQKITYKSDLPLLENLKEDRFQAYRVIAKEDNKFRFPYKESITTQGYDVHAYTDESDPQARTFKLGTVSIPSKFFIKAHSDGDVLLHALVDALLGLLSMGDIGTLFPDTKEIYTDIPSSLFVDKVLSEIENSPIKVLIKHVDITIIAQEPKILPYIARIRSAIIRLLNLSRERVSIKSTTEEKLGFTGELKGIKVSVILSAERMFFN